MKSAFILFTVFLILVSCDLLLLSGAHTPSSSPSTTVPDIPDTPDVTPSAIEEDIISFTGERYEKYYWTLDPVYYDKIVTISGSTTFNAYGSNQCTNTLTINNFRLEYFYIPGSYEIQSNGHIGIYGRIISVPNDYYNFPFTSTTTVTISDLSSLNYSGINDEYKIIKPFSNDSLSLPKTAPYSNLYSTTRGKSYRYYISSDQFFAIYTAGPSRPALLISNPGSINGYYPRDITLSASSTDPCILKSRDFFQYYTIKIVFDPELIIYDRYLSPGVQPIIYTHSIECESNGSPGTWKNSLTIIFKDYNEPYVGPVFSYWVLDGQGKPIEKIIRIAE